MVEKNSTFDLIFFEGDFGVLDFRINFLNNQVKKFIIVSPETFEESLKKQFNLYEKVEFIFSEDEETVDTEIRSILKKFYTSFLDSVFLSVENQIPNLEKLRIDKFNFLDINPLEQKVYEKDWNNFRKYDEIGSLMLTYSFILKNKIFLPLYKKRKKIFSSYPTVIKNGFILNNFFSDDKTYLKYYCPFSEKNTNLYSEIKTQTNTKKYILNFDIDDDLDNTESQIVLKIKTTNVFPENVCGSNNGKVLLFLPNEVIYDSNQNFEKVYLKNEIPRILNEFLMDDDDLIQINWSDNTQEIYKFSEIKNPS